MLMCDKVTQKNLIDRPPTIPNFIIRKKQNKHNRGSYSHLDILPDSDFAGTLFFREIGISGKTNIQSLERTTTVCSAFSVFPLDNRFYVLYTVLVTA